MKKYMNKHLLLITVLSFVISLAGYFLLLFRLKDTLPFNQVTIYPISNWRTFLFFSKPLVYLIPFMILFTILSSYLISKNWGQEISINTTIHENNGTLERRSKIKFFSEDEKQLFKIMIDTQGEIYQNDLTQKSGMPRYQISRILSKFENYGLIKKERFGMTNIIRLNLEHIEID
jgi:hypothetical protein